MSGWLFLLAYVAGFVFTYRRAYVVIASDPVGDNSVFDRGASAALAMLICTMWPAVLVGYFIWVFLTPVTPAQREAELDERQRRVEDMEREVGLR